MTYQNIETADIDFVRDSVDRFGQPIVQAITKWLLPGGTELVWDYPSRMRSDAKSTADILAVYVNAGILTKDEARATLNRPPLIQPEPPAGTAPINSSGNELAAADQQRQLAGTAQPLQITQGVEQ